MQGPLNTTEGPVETADSVDKVLGNLRRLAASRAFDELENLWIEAVESPQVVGDKLGSFVDVAEAVFRAAKEASRAGALAELLLGSLGESTQPQDAIRLYGLLVRCFPGKKDYRAAFAERYERAYPLASAERVFYEASGFTTGANPAQALTRLEKLLKFREGSFVYHASGWGVGKVLAVDPFLKQVRVDLEHKKDHRIAINAVDSILEPLPADSFRVLIHQGGDELKRLRDDDPVRLVSLLLDTFGSPIVLKDMKAHLIPRVIDAAGWNRWWNRAKGLLRDAGHFRVGDRAPYPVERLEKAVSYEDELLRNFKKSEWQQARQIARQVARRGPGELEAAWQGIREFLISFAQSSSGPNAIEAALILDRGEPGGGRDILRRLFQSLKAQELVTTLQDLPGVDEQRRAVESLPETRPEDWTDLAVLIFKCRRDSLRDAALELLEKRSPERIQATLRELVKAPKAAPEAFCFMLQAHLKGAAHSSLDVFKSRGPRELLVLVMDLLEHLQHQAERKGRVTFKDLVGRVEDLLERKDGEFFREGIRQMSSEDRRELYARVVKNESLLPQVKGALLQAMIEVEPSIHLEKETPPWEENCIYVTQAGLEKRKDEFREITEVKLPKNFKDIGRAREFGDLSENAEYTAALEERDNLTKRATRMEEELKKVKLITPDMVPKDTSGLGSKIHLRNVRTGQEVTYSVLGPWDGGPEDGVLSYLSPLGREFHGRREGEEVEAHLPGGTEVYKLLRLGSHFDKDG